MQLIIYISRELANNYFKCTTVGFQLLLFSLYDTQAIYRCGRCGYQKIASNLVLKKARLIIFFPKKKVLIIYQH